MISVCDICLDVSQVPRNLEGGVRCLPHRNSHYFENLSSTYMYMRLCVSPHSLGTQLCTRQSGSHINQGLHLMF